LKYSCISLSISVRNVEGIFFKFVVALYNSNNLSLVSFLNTPLKAEKSNPEIFLFLSGLVYPSILGRKLSS